MPTKPKMIVPLGVFSVSSFAALKYRNPSAVRHWIRRGKISPASLMLLGGKVFIIAESATRDLAENLSEPHQRNQLVPIVNGKPVPPRLRAE